MTVSLKYAPQTYTREDFDRIFEIERRNDYPTVDAWEEGCGFKVERERLEAAARVLSCPIKAAAPNWQHGRVIYATWRNYLDARIVARAGEVTLAYPVTALDVGTAKGFSSLCARWAIDDSCVQGTVDSVDVMSPKARVRRNTVAEVDELKTLWEILEPFEAAERIAYHECTGIQWLRRTSGRVHLAFVDGKHSYEAVREEAKLLAKRQEPGDLVIFDDTQMPPVDKAVQESAKYYDLSYLPLGSVNRRYAIGVRK